MAFEHPVQFPHHFPSTLSPGLVVHSEVHHVHDHLLLHRPGDGQGPGDVKSSGPLIQYCLEELGKRGCGSSSFCRDIITMHYRLLQVYFFRRTLSNMDTSMYTITHQVFYFYFLIKMVRSIISRYWQGMIFLGVPWERTGRRNYILPVQENPPRVFEISEDNKSRSGTRPLLCRPFSGTRWASSS